MPLDLKALPSLPRWDWARILFDANVMLRPTLLRLLVIADWYRGAALAVTRQVCAEALGNAGERALHRFKAPFRKWDASGDARFPGTAPRVRYAVGASSTIPQRLQKATVPYPGRWIRAFAGFLQPCA